LSVGIFPESVRLRPIALPVEHGGWGFILEPLLLGLAVAPSLTGLLVALGAIAGFLFRQPIRIVWADFASDRDGPRTHAAVVIAGFYFVLACTFLTVAIVREHAILVPLAAALPAVAAVLVLDSMKKSRTLAAEILGPIALGSTGAAVAIGGGLSLTMAFVIWALVAARAIPAILYVRARLRLEYGEPWGLAAPITSHVAAVALASSLAFVGIVAHVVSLVYLVLLTRAGFGLSRLRRRLSAKAVGFTEIGWGLFTIVSLAFLLRL
jgi:hypothetical protein